jgi:ketosteroid isomerase-like protein
MAALTAEDRLDIIERLARYAWALDTADVETLIANFTPDAVITMMTTTWQGANGVREFAEHFANDPVFPGRQHHISQTVIEGEDDHASVRSYGLITHRMRNGVNFIHWQGYYADTLVKVNGKWLIKTRTYNPWDAKMLEKFPKH